MAISPHEIRARTFTTVKRGGYDQREVEAFRTAAAEALEQASQQAAAMEARARAAVARLQELQQAPPAQAAEASPAAEPAVASQEAEISRALLLAQRTADTTIAEAQQQATEIVEGAKAESRKAGEAERVRVEGEVQALLARRDFLESDVDQLEQFLGAQRERITAVAAQLNDVTTRVGNGLGPMRRPQLSASDSEHGGAVAPPDGGPGVETGDDEEADVAELIEQVGGSQESDADAAPAVEGERRHSLFGADESR
jgi:DivIVA domain-containing protein